MMNEQEFFNSQKSKLIESLRFDITEITVNAPVDNDECQALHKRVQEIYKVIDVVSAASTIEDLWLELNARCYFLEPVWRDEDGSIDWDEAYSFAVAFQCVPLYQIWRKVYSYFWVTLKISLTNKGVK